MLFRCLVCNFQGTQRDVRNHIQQSHSNILSGQPSRDPAAAVPDSEYYFSASTKEADGEQWPSNTYDQDPTQGQQDMNADPSVPADPQTPPTTDEEKVEVGNETTPAERFDDSIQDVADKAAAKQFSLPDEQKFQQIAQQYGLDPDQVKQSLFIVTQFGNYGASNGTLGDNAQAPDGYVQVEGLGGHVDSHEALVPTDMIIQQVSKELNMDPELVYNMVKDRYGDDLPDKYHASVSGDQTFYLPGDMIGPQQDPSQEQPQQQEQAPDQAQSQDQQLPPEPDEQQQQF